MINFLTNDFSSVKITTKIYLNVQQFPALQVHSFSFVSYLKDPNIAKLDVSSSSLNNQGFWKISV